MIKIIKKSKFYSDLVDDRAKRRKTNELVLGHLVNMPHDK